MNKPFNKKLYDDTAWVVDTIIDKIKLEGFTCVKNSYFYDIDILIMKEKRVIGKIEGELHGKYWDTEFIFPSVHFLGRKTKYIGEKSYYLMVNKDGSQCVMMPFQKLGNYKLVTIDNVACKNELMYDVPKADCIWGWDNINKYIFSDLMSD